MLDKNLAATRTAADTKQLGGASGIGSVVWATGYRRRYPWLHLPVLDPRGEIAHVAGRTGVHGLAVLAGPA